MESLTKEDIIKYYTELQSQILVYNENKEYAEGMNPTILKAERKKDPDNRITVALAKTSVESLSGYSGSNIKVDYAGIKKEEKETEKEDAYRETINRWQELNEDALITSRLYKEACSHREVYLLMWTTDKEGEPGLPLTPEYEVIGMDEMVVIWNDEIKPKLKAAIRFTETEDKKTATVYYPLRYETWICAENEWSRNIEGDGISPFTEVQVMVFKIGHNSGPLFQAEKPIIDAYDSGVSKSQNEMDRYNALVALFPSVVSSDLIKRLEESKVLDDLEQYDADKWPRYLEKNMQGIVEYTSNHLDRLERLFHKTIKVVDFAQINEQGGDESGVARAFKLLGMEFKASEIEKTFNKGFMKRTKLFNDIIRLTSDINPDDYRTVVTAKRNLPVDELTKMQIAQGLQVLGVRKETILKVLPGTIIEDVKAEVEAMEEAETKRDEEFAKTIDNDV